MLPGPTLPLRSSARGPWHSPTLAGCPARGASRMRRPDTGAYRAGAGQRRLGPSKEVRGMRLQLRRDGGAVCLRSRQIRRQLEPLVLPPTRRGQRIRLAPALRAAVAFHGPSRGPCGPRSSAPSLRSSRPLGLEVAVGPGPRSERMPARPEARGRLCLVRPERQPSRSQATRGRNEPALVTPRPAPLTLAVCPRARSFRIWSLRCWRVPRMASLQMLLHGQRRPRLRGKRPRRISGIFTRER